MGSLCAVVSEPSVDLLDLPRHPEVVIVVTDVEKETLFPHNCRPVSGVSDSGGRKVVHCFG